MEGQEERDVVCGPRCGEGNTCPSLLASAGEMVWRENGFHRPLKDRTLTCTFGSEQWQAVWGSEADNTETKSWK